MRVTVYFIFVHKTRGQKMENAVKKRVQHALCGRKILRLLQPG